MTLAVEESDSTLRLRLSGDFDRAGVGPVENALHRVFQAPRQGASYLTYEVSPSSTLAGLRTILRTDAHGRAEEFEVVVVRPRGTANRVFTLTRAGERLNIVDEPDAA